MLLRTATHMKFAAAETIRSAPANNMPAVVPMCPLAGIGFRARAGAISMGWHAKRRGNPVGMLDHQYAEPLPKRSTALIPQLTERCGRRALRSLWSFTDHRAIAHTAGTNTACPRSNVTRSRAQRSVLLGKVHPRRNCPAFALLGISYMEAVREDRSSVSAILCRLPGLLDKGESIRAESGAMVSMDAAITIETKATGGLLKSLSRSFLGGESFFQNTFTATADGEVLFAPSLPGDINVMQLSGRVPVGPIRELSREFDHDHRRQQMGWLPHLLRRRGALHAQVLRRRGTLITSSFGAIHKVSLEAGRRYTIDTGHIVALDSHMPYGVRKVGSWKSTIFGGEGLVVDFTGPGDVYLQTRSPEAFLGWLIPHVPRQS